MSPGNSYFKDAEIRYLLQRIVEKFGRTAILIADVPAISTYEAFGYSAGRARSKAVLKGNNLKNRTRKIQHELGYADDQVRIIDWAVDVANNPNYKRIYADIHHLYQANDDFRAAVRKTTQGVIEGANRDIPSIDQAIDVATHYLLSELSFLEFAPAFLDSQNVVYVYHKNWPVYENYIAGKFDNKPKLYLDFLLVEHPHETYLPLQSVNGHSSKQLSTLDMIKQSGIIRGAFANYPPSFIEYDDATFGGLFYDLITWIASDLGVQVEFTEEVGYGVIVDGLNERRFDVFCSAVWPTPERQAQALFSQSLYESPAYMWVRQVKDKTIYDDIKSNRFFRIAVKENDISYSIANADFPHARQVRVPQLLDTMGLLEFVADDKADATFAEPYLVRLFNERSNTKLVAVTREPVRCYPNTFMLRKGESDFQKLLDAKINEAAQAGLLKELIRKHAGSESALLISEDMYL